MMKFLKPNNEKILKMLKYPQGKINMVLDTDTYNEVDDQFALVYALSSPERLNVEAIYAAPFSNDRSTGPKDGMEKSYDEIVRLVGKMNVSPQGFVYKGSDRYLPDLDHPVESQASKDLVRRAKLYNEDNPLYVVSIAAITNVASAILMAPEIINNIVVVWLGGHPLYWKDTKEFNLYQDILSARVILNSGVPFVQIPCLGVASHLLTTVPELEAHLVGKNAICDSLVELFKEYNKDHFGWAKEIWDISTIAYLINEKWVPTDIVHSPIVTDQGTWSIDAGRHFMKTATFINRNEVFMDMFRKLGSRKDS
jgi:purine nucleosidase